MAYGALPAAFKPHVNYPVRNTRSFWRTRNLAFVLLAALTLLYLFNPLHHIPYPGSKNNKPHELTEEEHRQQVLDRLLATGGDPLAGQLPDAGDPLAPGPVFAPPPGSRATSDGYHEQWEQRPAVEEESKKIAEWGVYPDEWEAIKQEEARKHLAEEDRRKDEEDAKQRKEKEDEDKTQKVKAEKQKAKAKAKADRQKAEAADTSKDRDKPPKAQSGVLASSKDGAKDGKTTPSNRVSLKLDQEASTNDTSTTSTKLENSGNITTTIVAGRMAADNSSVAWIHNHVKDITHKRIYIVDDPTAELSLKQNKGREAMVYLKYILDFYDELDDVTLFFHSSRESWHNSILFNRNAAIMASQLNRSYVLEAGYVNARCEHYPGCTGRDKGWILFNATKEQSDEHWERNADLFKQSLWDRLFPNRKRDPVYLSEPCCSQFGVSRATIRANPKSTYQRIHDWLGTTDEFDGYTGRIMEYTWQYLFLNRDEVCPNMRECYCKAYSLCLDDEGADKLEQYNTVREEIDVILGKLEKEDKERGCDKYDHETQEEQYQACIKYNSWLAPLHGARDKKARLESQLPRQWGIMRPGGKVGDGIGTISGAA